MVSMSSLYLGSQTPESHGTERVSPCVVTDVVRPFVRNVTIVLLMLLMH